MTDHITETCEDLLYPAEDGESLLWFLLGAIPMTTCVLTILWNIGISRPLLPKFEPGTLSGYAGTGFCFVAGLMFWKLAQLRGSRVTISQNCVTAVDRLGRVRRIPISAGLALDHMVRLWIAGPLTVQVKSPFSSLYRLSSGATEVYVNLDRSEDPAGEAEIISLRLSRGTKT